MSLRPDAPTPRRSGDASAPSDAHVAIVIIAGIVVMFIVGFLLLVISMASDWQ